MRRELIRLYGEFLLEIEEIRRLRLRRLDEEMARVRIDRDAAVADASDVENEKPYDAPDDGPSGKLYEIGQRKRDVENDTIGERNYIALMKNLTDRTGRETNVWFLNESLCSICLESNGKSAKINHCQHVVCATCIEMLLSANPTAKCPECRGAITSYETFDTETMRVTYRVNEGGSATSNSVEFLNLLRVALEDFDVVEYANTMRVFLSNFRQDGSPDENRTQ